MRRLVPGAGGERYARAMKLVRWLLLALVTGCGGGGDSPSSPPPATRPPVLEADISLLFMGNSHTSVNNLTGMVAAMVRAARPGRTVRAVEAPGWMFLDERAADAASLELLREGGWTYVVLQAQKYSSSGMFEYPIDGAVDLVKASRGIHAVPILFPEWSRRGIDETQRIYDLHVSIALREAACVSPIPQAWDLALSRNPALVLHAPDGNHSAPAGAFLAALVIAATMTRAAPDQLPDIAGFGIEPAVQAELRSAAADAVRAFPPRQYCPGDP
jgi:hypothetical protein